MFSDAAHTLTRARRVLDEFVWPAVYPRRHACTVTAWQAPGEPVSFAEGSSAPHTPIAPGAPWGAPWSTWWFEISGTVPPDFAGQPVELLVDLGFTRATPGFQCEGLLYDADGTPLKGVQPRNHWWRVSDRASGGEHVHVHLEAGANVDVLDGDFLPSPLGERSTAGDAPAYVLGAVDLAVLDEQTYALALDLEVLLDLAGELGEDDYRRHEVADGVRQAMALLHLHDIGGTAADTRAQLAPLLAAPAREAVQHLTAVGHAHIDTAWLFPLRETRRKVARTFANAASLAQAYPDAVFAASAAQHYAWLREDQPAIYERVRERLADGTWEVVGGQWVEADGVVPSGESFARQFLHGQSFFQRELGVTCSGGWLPDSFGYSAAYPQIARLGGARWFLTQKLSWNDTNTFPHHSFWWEGIDGTRVLTHFPPADTYNAELRGAELHRSQRQFRDKGRSRLALVPYGYGDGGGGPTREMVERGRRLGALDGAPRVRLGTAGSFFEQLREEYGDRAPVWAGELYLELHRGTLTSQHAMKEGNRASESLLRQAELVWSAVAATGRGEWPAHQLQAIWQRVLTLQFHDILPGSSIAWVHREAREDYARITAELKTLIQQGIRALGLGPGAVLNASPFERVAVIETPLAGAGGAHSDTGETRGVGRRLVRVPASFVGAPTALEPAYPVRVERPAPDVVTVGNGLVQVRVRTAGESVGRIESIRDLRAADGGREVLPEGRAGLELRLHPDLPAKWDAWDIDIDHADAWTSPTDVSVELTEESPLRTVLEIHARVGGSSLTKRLTLDADSPRLDVTVDIDWQERESALVLYLPVAVLAPESSAEIQFGHLRRPTHENTSWEHARFEMVAHRWLHVAEPEQGWGVALVNGSSYGHHVARSLDERGEAVTTMRVTLLRSPSSPDPDADRGGHVLRFGVVPGAGVLDAIEHGYAVNLPIAVAGAGMPEAGAVGLPEPGSDASGHDARGSESRGSDGGDVSGSDLAALGMAARAADSVVRVDNPGVVVEAVKLAQDGSGDLIVRLYEGLGRRVSTTVTVSLPWTSVVETDLLEDGSSEVVASRPSIVSADPQTGIRLGLRPFQIVTLRLRR